MATSAPGAQCQAPRPRPVPCSLQLTFQVPACSAKSAAERRLVLGNRWQIGIGLGCRPRRELRGRLIGPRCLCGSRRHLILRDAGQTGRGFPGYRRFGARFGSRGDLILGHARHNRRGFRDTCFFSGGGGSRRNLILGDTGQGRCQWRAGDHGGRDGIGLRLAGRNPSHVLLTRPNGRRNDEGASALAGRSAPAEGAGTSEAASGTTARRSAGFGAAAGELAFSTVAGGLILSFAAIAVGLAARACQFPTNSSRQAQCRSRPSPG